MKSESLIIFSFVLSLVGITALAHKSIAADKADVSAVDVQMQCNTMVGVFEIDPVAAREVYLPSMNWLCSRMETHLFICRHQIATASVTVKRSERLISLMYG